ncbi:MAG: extracellular solute-binding protein [Oscillospiraceae bacterium]|nr:extracellular solute-binding protein [Oscillospiraceae bacterium]
MKRTLAVLLSLIILTGITGGCSNNKNGLDPQSPVTLTMWHNFGGDMQKTMDTLIDEFNSTEGKEQGVIINVTAITSSAELQETLNRIVNGDPGAPAMPDITTSYPKTAVLFQEKGLLANLDDYFTSEELENYVPQFVAEGRFGEDNGLYVFPFAKSTEILYLNQTLFDAFSAETGIGMDSLSSFEGIAQAATAYYRWTDAQTPDIPDDGKAFYAADSWVNLAQAGAIQLGDSLFQEEALRLDTDAYRHIWDVCYAPAISGGFALYDGYSSDLSKTGDLICSTGSSAGILFYGDTITYPDNTTQQVEYSILPFPTFEGGKKVAIQRGNGFCVAASDDKKREQAAALFLKWFTRPEQNMRFISSTGYLPVTQQAFEVDMEEEINRVEDPRIRKMLGAVTQMYAEYDFFVAPVFEGFDSISKSYETDLRLFLTNERDNWLESTEREDPATRAEGALERFAVGR